MSCYKQYFYSILLILCFTQCINEKKNIDQNVYTLKINPKELNSIKFSDLFSAQEIIKISNDSVNVLKKPSKLLFMDNCYFFHSNNILFVYDQYGKNIFNINKKGSGPGEYITISDFTINRDEKLLEINDGEARKIIRYDMSGEYVDEIKHGLYSSNFTTYKNDFYLCSGRTINADIDYSIHIIDTQTGNVTKRIMEVSPEEKYLNFIEYTNFATWKDTLSYSSSISNTIYQIKDRKLFPRLNIDFGKSALPLNIYSEYTNLGDFVNFLGQNKYAARIDGYTENSLFLFFVYTYGSQRPFVLLDKKKDISYNFSSFENDFLFPAIQQQTAYDMLPVFMDENYCYWMVEAFQFIELFDEAKAKMTLLEYDEFTRKNQEANIIYKSLNPEDNPLILKYKFK